MLPPSPAQELGGADGQILRRPQDRDAGAGKDRAETRILNLDIEVTHQDGDHIGFLLALIDVVHDAIHSGLHAQVQDIIARHHRVPYSHGLLPLEIDLQCASDVLAIDASNPRDYQGDISKTT